MVSNRHRAARRRKQQYQRRVLLLTLSIGLTATIIPFAYSNSFGATTVKPLPLTDQSIHVVLIKDAAAESSIEESSPEEPAFKALNIPMNADLQSDINDLCQQYDTPFELIIAMMDNESDFKPDAVSADEHDYGLMQIRDVNHPQLTTTLGVTDFLDPLQNAKCGIYMISGFIKKYGDLNLALMAYNCGESGARKLWDKGTYSTEYSRSIIRQMDKFTAERKG